MFFPQIIQGDPAVTQYPLMVWKCGRDLHLCSCPTQTSALNLNMSFGVKINLTCVTKLTVGHRPPLTSPLTQWTEAVTEMCSHHALGAMVAMVAMVSLVWWENYMRKAQSIFVRSTLHIGYGEMLIIPPLHFISYCWALSPISHGANPWRMGRWQAWVIVGGRRASPWMGRTVYRWAVGWVNGISAIGFMSRPAGKRVAAARVAAGTS